MRNFFEIKRKYGWDGLMVRAYRKFFPSAYKLNNPIRRSSYLVSMFFGKNGLEIGGPSDIFKDHIPVYGAVASLDGCNFSNSTMWEGDIKLGNTYCYGNKTGQQYLSEATDLAQINSEKYDFIISSNCLEHVANPLKAVNEWLRVIKDNGIIMIIVPNKRYCFDHRRKYTSFSHILNDYNENRDERDLTHLQEILQYHDLDMDKPAGTPDQFKQRSLHNFENRGLHHHVFSVALLKSIFLFFKVKILFIHSAENLTIIGRK